MIERKDDYMLISFVSDFKGLQFVGGIIALFLKAVSVLKCAGLRSDNICHQNRATWKCKALYFWGKRSHCNDTLIDGLDFGLKVGCVYLAIWLLNFSESLGGKVYLDSRLVGCKIELRKKRNSGRNGEICRVEGGGDGNPATYEIKYHDGSVESQIIVERIESLELSGTGKGGAGMFEEGTKVKVLSPGDEFLTGEYEVVGFRKSMDMHCIRCGATEGDKACIATGQPGKRRNYCLTYSTPGHDVGPALPSDRVKINGQWTCKNCNSVLKHGKRYCACTVGYHRVVRKAVKKGCCTSILCCALPKCLRCPQCRCCEDIEVLDEEEKYVDLRRQDFRILKFPGDIPSPVRYLWYWDIFFMTLVVTLMGVITIELYPKSIGKYPEAIEWGLILYQITSFPWLLLKIPGLKRILTHAQRTGYTKNGVCVAHNVKKERFDKRNEFYQKYKNHSSVPGSSSYGSAGSSSSYTSAGLDLE